MLWLARRSGTLSQTISGSQMLLQALVENVFVFSTPVQLAHYVCYTTLFTFRGSTTIYSTQTHIHTHTHRMRSTNINFTYLITYLIWITICTQDRSNSKNFAGLSALGGGWRPPNASSLSINYYFLNPLWSITATALMYLVKCCMCR